MRTGLVYPTLARILENWRARSSEELAVLVAAPPEVHELNLDGEQVRVEVSAIWADAQRQAVVIEAVRPKSLAHAEGC